MFSNTLVCCSPTNSESNFAEYSVHLSSAKTPGILSAVKERTFWVSWEQNTVRFGRGALVGKDLLLKWRLVKKMKVNHIGFASSWGQTADFRSLSDLIVLGASVLFSS